MKRMYCGMCEITWDADEPGFSDDHCSNCGTDEVEPQDAAVDRKEEAFHACRLLVAAVDANNVTTNCEYKFVFDVAVAYQAAKRALGLG